MSSLDIGAAFVLILVVAAAVVITTECQENFVDISELTCDEIKQSIINNDYLIKECNRVFIRPYSLEELKVIHDVKCQ